MSSESRRFDVELSEQARRFLLDLPTNKRKELAQFLIILFKSATPEESLELETKGQNFTDHLWVVGEFEIVYRCWPAEHRIAIGIIRRTN
ncbi:MAG TPA: hypothetical protein VMU84_13620 [Thermoanaerobaculia bacterium]|nr:hypothetical protein [Thermoanaerobaculia bacterium]